MKTKNTLSIIFGMLLVLLAVAPLTQASTLGANLFYEDSNTDIRSIEDGESFYIEAYGDAFEEKITSAKLILIDEDTNDELIIFSESAETVFYSKTHYSIDSSKYPGEGEYTLEFVVKGEFGTQASDELSLEVLSQGTNDPQVSINSPQEGETMDSSQVSVEFNATDNGNIETCQYILNEGNRQNIDNCGDGLNSFTMSDVQEGLNNLTIYATDYDGNEGNDSVSFSVDESLNLDAPQITIDSPIDGETYEENNIQINITTDEPALLEYEVNGTESISKRSLSSGYESSYNTEITLDEGNYTLTIYATDSEGNENSVSINFEITSDLSSEENSERDNERNYEHKIYTEQYEPKTTKIDLTEDDESLKWWQKVINWLWELFGAKTPY